MWIPSSWRFLLSSRTWLAPVTLATRADEAGEPPLKVLRDLGQPHDSARRPDVRHCPLLPQDPRLTPTDGLAHQACSRAMRHRSANHNFVVLSSFLFNVRSDRARIDAVPRELWA